MGWLRTGSGHGTPHQILRLQRELRVALRERHHPEEHRAGTEEGESEERLAVRTHCLCGPDEARKIGDKTISNSLPQQSGVLRSKASLPPVRHRTTRPESG